MSDEQDMTLEEAFEAAFYWRGKPLHPLSWKRQAAFDRLRTQGAALENAVILVRLCLMTPREIEATRHDSARFREEAEKWAEAEKINIGSEAHGRVIKLAGDLLESVYITEAEPKEKAEGSSPK